MYYHRGFTSRLLSPVAAEKPRRSSSVNLTRETTAASTYPDLAPDQPSQHMWRRAVSRAAASAANTGSVNSFTSITAGLAEFYKWHVLPLEKDFRFAQFYSPVMTDGDFKAKPMVLLVGQYSTGKVLLSPQANACVIFTSHASSKLSRGILWSVAD